MVVASFDGCEDLTVGAGVDVLNVKNGWVAEIKNKHNTVKGSDNKGIYDSLEKAISKYKDKHRREFCGYYVQIIPKGGESYDKPFRPSDNTKKGQKRPDNEKIRIISGPLFYEQMSGQKNALKMLFDVLPLVLKQNFGLDCKITNEEMENLFKASFLGGSLKGSVLDNS